MKKGFTLLELIVVIIIIGILATLGITQYTKVIEKARSAEAKQIIGAIRSNAAAVYMQNNNSCTNCTATNVGIGSDYPGPAAANCASANYFWYNVTANDANSITTLATRCLAGGKTPQGIAPAGTVQLVSDFRSTGGDTWTTTGGY
ncbi:MAG: prepilin-type N-terminal cleavage/methylation domain-containing protein [Candidatus Omnitrophota bacterium]